MIALLDTFVESLLAWTLTLFFTLVAVALLQQWC